MAESSPPSAEFTAFRSFEAPQPAVWVTRAIAEMPNANAWARQRRHFGGLVRCDGLELAQVDDPPAIVFVRAGDA